MSASLVGSEMCIRDRSLNCAGPRTASASNPEAQQWSESLKHRLGKVATAVSYTHLTLPTICSV
eukprot:8092364-Alexandrium_andersonii.AAC.1